jgi:hypothetical protein
VLSDDTSDKYVGLLPGRRVLPDLLSRWKLLPGRGVLHRKLRLLHEVINTRIVLTGKKMGQRRRFRRWPILFVAPVRPAKSCPVSVR